MADSKTLHERLAEVQATLKAPKGQRNTFGNYNYRSCEDILEAVKPLLKEQGLVLTLMDELQNIGDRYYIKATATVSVNGELYEMVTAYAREEETKKGMDGSQITGTASSYARKYALNGLFLIDDTKDADTDEHRNQTTSSGSTSQQVSTLKKATPAPGDGGDSDVKCEIPSCHNSVWASKVETSKKYNKGHVICYFHSTNGNWEEQLEREIYELESEGEQNFAG